jgi:hypothetical protein
MYICIYAYIRILMYIHIHIYESIHMNTITHTFRSWGEQKMDSLAGIFRMGSSQTGYTSNCSSSVL